LQPVFDCHAMNISTAPSWLKSRCGLLMLLALCLLTACAVPGPSADEKQRQAAAAAKPPPPPKGTVLWVIRFSNELEPQLPPTSLAVFVENQSRTHGGQFSFKAHQTEPGQFSEFALRLDLPPGPYRITRLIGTAGEGVTASQFDFAAQMGFNIIDRETSYLGNLAITNRARQDDKLPATAPRPASGATDAARFSQGTPLITANNEVKDDVVTLHTLWPDLRKRRLVTRLPQRMVVLGPDSTLASGIEVRFPAPGAPSGEYVTAAPLAADAGLTLSAPLQKEFAKFMRMKLPRAFAVGPADVFGVASGQEVVARALATCTIKRDPRLKDSACRLYAVDDTVMSAPVTRAPIKPAAPPAQRAATPATPASGAATPSQTPMAPLPQKMPSPANDTQPAREAAAPASPATTVR
jgi:hypothetical protein